MKLISPLHCLLLICAFEAFAASVEDAIAAIQKDHSKELGILAKYREQPDDYSNGIEVFKTAERFFSEVNFVGFSKKSVIALLGPSDINQTTDEATLTYSYGSGEAFVIRRFHFDVKDDVTKVEAMLSQ